MIACAKKLRCIYIRTVNEKKKNHEFEGAIATTREVETGKGGRTSFPDMIKNTSLEGSAEVVLGWV